MWYAEAIAAIMPSIAPSPAIEFVTLDIVVWWQGGGCGDDSDGDVIALAAMRAGCEWRNERGEGERRRQYDGGGNVVSQRQAVGHSQQQ